MAKTKLTLTSEQVGWLNDILQDYEAMIITATNTIKEIRPQWEELLKTGDSEKSKDLAEQLEKLNVDEMHIKVAEQRWTELQQLVWNFLGIKKGKDVETIDTTEWTPGADVWGEEPLHTADEAQEVVQ